MQGTWVQSLGQEEIPGEEIGNPLPYSSLGNPIDREAWWATVHGVAKNQIRLFKTPWTAAYQAPLSVGFSRQEYWSGMPFPSPSSVLSTLQLCISWVKRSPFCRGGTWGSGKFTAPPKNMKLEKKKKEYETRKRSCLYLNLGLQTP